MMKATFSFLFISALSLSTVFSQSENQLSSRRIKSYTTEITEVKNQNKVIKSQQNVLNKFGHTIEEKTIDENGNLIEWKKFERTKDGRIIKEYNFNSKGKIVKYTNFVYDRLLKIESEITADSNGIQLEKIIYTYNENGEKTKEEHFKSNNELKKTTEYAYDKRGMLILKRTLNDKGEVIFQKQITYEY